MTETQTQTQRIETGGSLPPIPKVYADLGAQRGYRPYSVDEVRLYIVALQGIGKTTFAAGDPHSLILDYEAGANGVPGCRAMWLPIRKWDDQEKLTSQLTKDGFAGAAPCRRLVIDTTDEWAFFTQFHLAEEKEVDDITDSKYGERSWFLVRNRCMAMLKELRRAGYAWTALGHRAEKQVTRGGQQTLEMRTVLYPSFHEALMRDCDIYAYLYRVLAGKKMTPKLVERGGKKMQVMEETPVYDVRLHLARNENNPETKVRGVPELNEDITIPAEGGWDAFKQAYNDALAKCKGA